MIDGGWAARAWLRGLGAGALCLVLLAAVAASAVASPNHPFLPERFGGSFNPLTGASTPARYFDDACGVALDSQGDIYVADYYHHAVDVFDEEGGYITQIAQVSPLDGPCDLAVDSAGRLYVNDWHQDVVRYTPSAYPFSFAAPTYSAGVAIDSDHATGVAVDPADDAVYVSHRTYVAAYQPSGEAVLFAGEPLRFGADSLGDAYGVAVSSFPATAGRVYVADASDGTVKAYDLAAGPSEPVAVFDGADLPGGGFASLVDADLAVDPLNGHLLILDNTEPGFEHPAARVYELDLTGAYRDRLAHAIVDAGPSAIAIGEAPGRDHGDVYVTGGNGSSNPYLNGPSSEEAVLYAFGPAGDEVAFPAAAGGGGAGAAAPTAASCAACGAAAASTPAAAGGRADTPRSHSHRRPAASASEIVQRGHLRVSFGGKLTPKALPRSGTAPVTVSVGARVSTTDGSDPPQLRRVEIAINRNGRFDPTGLPVCRPEQIQPATTEAALAACHRSLVGTGSFTARVLLAGQAPFPSQGRLYAFNGTLHGRPAILAHVYGTEPAPASYTLSFEVGRAKGRFGLLLRSVLPGADSAAGSITGLSLKIGRTYRYRGARHSYLSAGCPAPDGFPGALYPLARASFSFVGGQTLSSKVVRSCRVR